MFDASMIFLQQNCTSSGSTGVQQQLEREEDHLLSAVGSGDFLRSLGCSSSPLTCFSSSSSSVLPSSLLQLCRLRIHQLAGVKGLKCIRNLPERIIRFLNHNEQREDVL
ncbi:ankyrin repeat and SOCS box protein 2-like [Tachysurus ichikawai]